MDTKYETNSRRLVCPPSYFLQHQSYCNYRFYSVSREGLRQIAYRVLTKNGVKPPQEWKSKCQNEMMGQEWVRGFLRRHPTLSFRKPEAVSIARAHGFNKTAVAKFFENLESIITRYKLSGSQIYNMDETGMTVVPVNNIL